MDILKLNLWRGGLFKQAKFLVSTPHQVLKCIFISEAGVVSQELLPVHTGFVCAEEVKKAWLVLHTLKFQVKKHGLSVQDDAVLTISERSYVPLDPFRTIKQKDKERLTSLKDIARLRHAEVVADTSKQGNKQTRITELIINGGFVLLGIFAIITLLVGC